MLSYRPRVARVAILVLAVAVGWSELASPGAASGAAVPSWLARAAQRAAAGLSDGSRRTTIRYVAPQARFPRVVLRGSFVCHSCSVPYGAQAPRGTVALIRYDGLTHQSRDFALCPTKTRCDSNLCAFGACTRSRDALDAAFDAFDRRLRGIPGDPDTFPRQAGTYPCHIFYPVRETRYIVGRCTTALRLIGTHQALVTLTEGWRPRTYRHGRWVWLPVRSHTWRLLETHDYWTITIDSSGDPPPQLPAGQTR